jgi:hypothetical protein
MLGVSAKKIQNDFNNLAPQTLYLKQQLCHIELNKKGSKPYLHYLNLIHTKNGTKRDNRNKLA